MSRTMKEGSACGAPILSAVAMVLAFACLAALTPSSAGALDILVGTDEIGSFSHFTGRTVCRFVENELEDITCQPVPGPGDVHNLTNLRVGSLDMALIDSRMLHDAIHQTGYFRFFDIRYDSLRTVSILSDLPIALIVRSDARIDSLDSVKGKRINAGAPRSPEHLAFDTILAAKGWTPGDFSLVEELSSSQSVDTMAFCHGTIQVMLHIGVHPNNALSQLIRLCDARIGDLLDADIQKLVDKHPAFSAIAIPAGTYPYQQEAISTFGTRAVLVASIDLDVGTVSRITEVIYRNRQQFKAAHPALSPFPEDAPPGDALGIPPHPGVLQFFSERSR